MSYEAAHANATGAGDGRPTAMDIIKDEGLVDKLQGKVFLITGGNSGIGVETARAIYATGAHVYITSRCVGHTLRDILLAFPHFQWVLQNIIVTCHIQGCQEGRGCRTGDRCKQP